MSTTKKVFKCTEPDCPYETNRKYNLSRHLLYHGGEQQNAYECVACDSPIKDSYNLKKHRHSKEHCENVRNKYPECCKTDKVCGVAGVGMLLRTEAKYVNKYIKKRQTMRLSNTVKIGKLKQNDDDDEPVVEEEEKVEEVEEEECFKDQIVKCEKNIAKYLEEIIAKKLKGAGWIKNTKNDIKSWTGFDEETYFKFNDLEYQLEELLSK